MSFNALYLSFESGTNGKVDTLYSHTLNLGRFNPKLEKHTYLVGSRKALVKMLVEFLNSLFCSKLEEVMISHLHSLS